MYRQQWTRILSALFTIFAFLLIGAVPAGAVTRSVHERPVAPTACGVWSIVISPNVGTGANALFGVAAVSASDVWAVGHYTNTSNVLQTLIEQWAGTSWSVVTSPNAGTGANSLAAVTAISADEVWAVGYADNTSGVPRTLIEEWNGTSWGIVPSPNVGPNANYLYAVAGDAANDVWAAGVHTSASGRTFTMIEHWDGTSWSVVPSPSLGTGNNVLSGVAAITPTDAWVVGSYVNGSNVTRTLIEQWNGTNWGIVHSADIGTGMNSLAAVTALSASDVWAVGVHQNASGGQQALIEQWNGSRWAPIASAHAGSVNNFLTGVAALSTTNIWAAGGYFITGKVNQAGTEQWNGTKWVAVSSPNEGTGPNFFNGIAAVPGSTSQLWAVGSYAKTSTSPAQTLIEQRC